MNRDLRNQGLLNNTIANSGATYSSDGKLGGCYIFDGADDSLTVGNLSTIVDIDFSFACWFYHDDTWSSKNYETIFGGPSGFELEAKNGSTKSPIIRAYSWGGSTFTYELNKWNHLVMTRTDSETKFYLNGELKLTGSAGNIPSGNYFIGSWSSTTNQNYKGKICDVRIYDHCLSPMEVKELAKGLVLHYPLNRGGWGQENLGNFASVVSNWTMDGLSGSNYIDSSYGNVIKLVTSSTYKRMYNYVPASMWQSGKVYTVSFLAKADTNGRTCDMSRSIADFSPTFALTTNWKRYNGRITSTATPNGGTLSFRIHDSGATVYITQIKVEEGELATPYCPYYNESLYTTMGLNSTTEYDCSGFCNNGTKNNITYTSDTPKYAVSSIFNGSNSYIKVNDNNWMVKGMSEMTVNLWAKTTTWPTNGGRLLSCTESGGFNLEAGNSGHWRFPVYVYTNSGQTSSAYKYDSNEIKIADLIPDDWNMITLVYDTTGTKTYLNGELHHTYTNTSYGINFNTNARLFLGCEASTANPSSPYFNGKECDFRIYATALSASDVKSLYQNCATIDPDGTIRGQIRS